MLKSILKTIFFPLRFLLFCCCLFLSLAETSQAAFPGTNNTVLYVEDCGGNSKIRAVESDGSNDRLFFNGGRRPAWSADGKFVAIDQGGSVRVLSRTGAFVKTVSLNGYNPSWSPDGKKIVYSTAETITGAGDIWVVDVDNPDTKTRIAQRATSNDEIIAAGYTIGSLLQPSWSPDGSKIAYIAQIAKPRIQNGFVQDFGIFHYDLMVMNADGSGKTKLTDIDTENQVDFFTDFNPDWSPDSQSIIFERSSNVVIGNDIAIISIGGGSPQILIPTSQLGSTGLDPHYAPEGNRIVYSGTTPLANFGKRQIFTVSSGGGTGELLRPLVPTTNFCEPAWGPAPAGTLSGSATVNAANVSIDEEFIYKVTVRNTGSVPLFNVRPSASPTLTGAGAADLLESPAQLVIDELSPGDSAMFEFKYRANRDGDLQIQSAFLANSSSGGPQSITITPVQLNVGPLFRLVSTFVSRSFDFIYPGTNFALVLGLEKLTAAQTEELTVSVVDGVLLTSAADTSPQVPANNAPGIVSSTVLVKAATEDTPQVLRKVVIDREALPFDNNVEILVTWKSNGRSKSQKFTTSLEKSSGAKWAITYPDYSTITGNPPLETDTAESQGFEDTLYKQGLSYNSLGRDNLYLENPIMRKWALKGIRYETFDDSTPDNPELAANHLAQFLISKIPFFWDGEVFRGQELANAFEAGTRIPGHACIGMANAMGAFSRTVGFRAREMDNAVRFEKIYGSYYAQHATLQIWINGYWNWYDLAFSKHNGGRVIRDDGYPNFYFGQRFIVFPYNFIRTWFAVFPNMNVGVGFELFGNEQGNETTVGEPAQPLFWKFYQQHDKYRGNTSGEFFHVTALSPVNLLFVDDRGRRLGALKPLSAADLLTKDRVGPLRGGGSVWEIPGGIYIAPKTPTPLNAANGALSELLKEEIMVPLSELRGKFKLFVVPTGTGPYSVVMYRVGSTNVPSPDRTVFRFDGVAEPGKIQSLEFSTATDSEGETTVSLLSSSVVSSVCVGECNEVNSILDEDLDGVSNCDEILDATNACEAADFIENLNPKSCVGVNGFLNQINIASIVNKLAIPLPISAVYRNQSGASGQAVNFVLSPFEKRDLIVNDIGLSADSYGQLCVSADTLLMGAWTGGVTVYRPRAGAGFGASGFDYAYYKEFANANQQPTFVPLNTFVPGQSQELSSANWLEISDANLDDESGLDGKLSIYNQGGAALTEIPVSLPNGGRIDIDAHSVLGKSAVGLAEFTANGGAAFRLDSGRYFYGAQGSNISGLNLSGQPARSGDLMFAQDGIAPSDISVVELNNPSAGALTFSALSIGSNNELAPKSTRHFILSDLLAGGETFALTSSGNTIGQQLNYSLTAAGKFQRFYTSFATRKNRPVQLAQFNTFLGNKNYLRLSNMGAELVKVTIAAFGYDSPFQPILSQEIEVGPEQRESVLLSLPANLYGSIIIDTNGSRNISADTLVERVEDYTFVIPAR